MFNHVSVGTRDLAGATRFYDAALGALGYRRTMSEEFGNAWGLEWPEFWVQPRRRARRSPATACMSRSSRRAARRSTASMPRAGAGGTDAGAPGERDYTPGYYAAFLRDPDGNKLEAVHPAEVPFPSADA